MSTPTLRPTATAAALLLALLAATGTAHAATPAGQADPAIFKAHMGFLADDLLEGRETGSRGYDIAARYVAGQFAQYGAAPRGDNGTYLQAVPFKTGRIVAGSSVFEIVRKGGTETLVDLQDFAQAPSLSSAATDVTAPLVFVGYGITAPGFKHDDYAGMDVKGKIVVVLNGRPQSFPTEEGAHYSSNQLKRELAAKHGAVGVIALQTPRGEKTFPFAYVKQYAGSLSMNWADKDGRGAHETPSIQGGAFLSMAAAAKLFSEVDTKLEAIYAAADAGQPVPRMDLKLSAHMARKSTLGDVQSSNVAAFIEGSDPALKNEYVVFTAHLDHLGIKPEKKGDNIYNGAMDNAAGIATLLEMARLTAQMPMKPKRSLLFVAVTGEEKGLLGSDFYATNPTVPLASIVANVNLDMPVLTYDFSNVIAFGAEHSTLKAVTAKAAAANKLGLVPDPWPDQGLFTRSDHYSFVRQGVPAISLVTGTGSFTQGEDGGKIFDTFLHTHYHQPSDDMKLPINWTAAARFAQVNFNLGVEIANSPERITWNKGDFFGDLFKKK